MIQRIQSVYLLVASASIAVALLFNLAVLVNDASVYNFLACGIYDNNQVLLFPSYPIFGLGAFAALLPLISIFAYKKRKAQIKMCYASILATLAFYVAFVVYLLGMMKTLDATVSTFGFAIALPAVAIILLLLAMKGIRADEKLVRSLDRIR